MTVARPPQPTGNSFKHWGTRLNDYLVRTRSQLVQLVANTSAVDDGMLVWDADNAEVLYSSNGSWHSIAGTPASLYHNGVAKITATADGVTAYGNITLDGFPESNYELKGDIDGAVRFHAIATEAISKGDVVYIVEHASSGSETKVAKALASNAAKMPAFGLALDNAAIDASVQIVTFGNLYGSGGAGNALDTSAYNSGTPLYVSATTAGEWTGTAPTGESNLVQNIGKVVRKQQTNGVIKVGGAGRTNATPNLDDGNIFIGDSNNQAVTASLATQVASLETSHADVLVDGDFASAGFMKTDGAGTYSIDNSTYLTDITTQTDPKYLRADGGVDTSTTFTFFNAGITVTNFTATGSTVFNTVNANSANLAGNITLTGTVDGRDVAADGAILDTLAGTETQSYHNLLSHSTGSSQILTTSLAQVGDLLFTKHQSSEYKTYVDLSLDLLYSNVSLTNDGYGYITVTAPTPSNETTHNLGTCTAGTTGVSYLTSVTVSGDWTEYLSPYAGLSTNSNGSNGVGLLYKWYYSPYAGQTTIWVSTYTNAPSTGDTIYLHPFDWESSGTLINGDIIQLDCTTDSTVLTTRTYKEYLGRFSSRVGFRFMAREQTTGDNISVDSIKMFVTENKV